MNDPLVVTEEEEIIINNKAVVEAIGGNIMNNKIKMIGGQPKKLGKNKMKMLKKISRRFRMTGMFKKFNRIYRNNQM